VEIAESYTQSTPADDYVCISGIIDYAYDFNGDCRIDIADFAMEWLGCSRTPEESCLD